MCYAYLSDVSLANGNCSLTSPESQSGFRSSKWFTRGWTLQELLVPATVRFFDREWVEIGTKSSLESLISSITGIEHLLKFEKACIAQKMSGAPRRETLRIEDQALWPSRPLRSKYAAALGEGEKALLRLQSEIIRM